MALRRWLVLLVTAPETRPQNLRQQAHWALEPYAVRSADHIGANCRLGRNGLILSTRAGLAGDGQEYESPTNGRSGYLK